MNTSACPSFSREVGVSGDAADRIEVRKGRKGSDARLRVSALVFPASVSSLYNETNARVPHIGLL